MSEDKKIIVKIKKKKQKKHIMKIKKIDKNKETAAHKLKVYSTKKFYEQYLKENETPTDFITNIKFTVCQIEHIFKYNPENLSGTDLNKILNDNLDVDMLLGILMETSTGKLKALGIMESCATILDKMYYIINRLQKEYGLFKGKKYNADELRFKLQLMKTSYQPIMKLNRMMVMRDNVIVQTSDMIEPSKSLKGTTIMVEYAVNRFVSVPYYYYKKLYNIKQLSIHMQVADSTEISLEKLNKLELLNDDEYSEVDDDDTFLYIDKILSSTDIYGHLNNIIRYINLWDCFDELTVELGTPYIPYRECIETIDSNGKHKKHDVPCFLSEFAGFL